MHFLRLFSLPCLQFIIAALSMLSAGIIYGLFHQYAYPASYLAFFLVHCAVAFLILFSLPLFDSALCGFKYARRQYHRARR